MYQRTERDGGLFQGPAGQYRVGRDFEVVTISINPKEGADLATAKKREYMDILAQPGAESGWHFLTGEEANIRRIADEVGFKYVYDPKTDQYAHPAGLVILTPDGKVSKYFFSVNYPARDLKLALTEAGQGRVGTPIDKFLLSCYHYDPKTGTYGPKVFAIMQVTGIMTILVLASFMVYAFRRDAKSPRLVRYADGTIGPDGEDGKHPAGAPRVLDGTEERETAKKSDAAE
jgi:protein SCO1